MIKKALIFSAGRGERLRPITLTTPKPLIEIEGKPLIVRHLERLSKAGVEDVVVNTSHLADQFPTQLGDGSDWGLRIHYAYEGPEPLETGGGMRNALEHFGSGPFIAVNGDIYTGFDFGTLPSEPKGLAHLVLSDNPAHNPEGDFHLAESGLLDDQATPRLTYTGIGVYRPELVERYEPGVFKLAPILRAAMAENLISGLHYRGHWCDVGSIERLEKLRKKLAGKTQA